MFEVDAMRKEKRSLINTISGVCPSTKNTAALKEIQKLHQEIAALKLAKQLPEPSNVSCDFEQDPKCVVLDAEAAKWKCMLDEYRNQYEEMSSFVAEFANKMVFTNRQLCDFYMKLDKIESTLNHLSTYSKPPTPGLNSPRSTGQNFDAKLSETKEMLRSFRKAFCTSLISGQQIDNALPETLKGRFQWLFDRR